VTIRPAPALHTDPWIFQFPAGQDSEPTTGLPLLRSASVPGIRAALSGTLFEPETLQQRLGLAGDAALNPASLALHAYIHDGDGWLNTLRGHFAVIIDDSRTGRLLAARDPMGTHPLFFADAKDALIFSWSTDALVAHPEVSSALNRVALAEHLVHRWSDASETYYAAVHRVPPGHVLEVSRGERRLRRYWDPSSNGAMEWLRDDEVERFDQALEIAVTRCLGRGRAAVFLSGGFDSVSVAAVAADVASRLGQPAPRALSLGFPDPKCNEEIVQRRVARALGMPQDFVDFNQAVGDRGLLIPAMEMASTWPMPMMNLWNPAYGYLAQRAHEHGCASILTGTGGDEWLTVSPYLAADNLRRGKFADVAHQIGMSRRSYQINLFQAVRSTLWTYGLRPLAGMLADRIAPAYWQTRRHRNVAESTPAWVAPDRALRQRLDDRADRVLLPSQPFRDSFYEREMRTALDHPLMALEAEEYFEMGRRLGVHIVHPYWDSDLVTLLYRTPPRMLSSGGRSKGLVRDTVARRFPKLGFERQRKVHATEFYWKTMQTEGPRAWEALGHASALADLGIVDASLLSDTMADLFAGRRPKESYRIWNTLHLEAWVRSRT
jgi:asparagine synthase (glutamine-hydrolysing)